MMTTEDARKLADMIRADYPEKAAEIDAVVAAADSNKQEQVAISVDIRYKLEKFEGEYEPGKQPVEVIEGVG